MILTAPNKTELQGTAAVDKATALHHSVGWETAGQG